MRTKLSDAKVRFGHIDVVSDTIVRGWAVDLSQRGQPAALLLLVDDHLVGSFVCTEPRPDLNALELPGDRLGFQFSTPDALIDGQPHRLSIRFRNGETLTFGAEGRMRDEAAVTFHPTTVHGMVDGMFGASIRGWAFRTGKQDQPRTGGVTLEVWASGVKVGQVKAGLTRSDVAAVHGCEPHCGFLYTVPPRFRDGRPFVLEFRAAPEGTQLEGSPFSGNVLVRDNADRLFEMYGKVEALCTQIYALKDQLRLMTAVDEHTLHTYNAWAEAYLGTLRARVVAERRSPRYAELIGTSRPKVSVVCPVYKPRLADFVHAVDSVRRQTWVDWELIIVDDGSRSPVLTQAIEEMCGADSRIRAVPHRKNQGISAATNTGIDAATGDWVALFDHDDLLVDTALEVMLLAGANTGAKVLYSDEDKIDPSGNLLEPHLKTDWNPRLLLGYNYVCHLLMVETATLRGVGPLRSQYDGAQDHDLILRLSETVPAAAIHHVPEVLYHWRKTPGSTAAAQSAKSYAVEAGRQAVQHHLQRRGLPATVKAPFASTLYDVRWDFRAEPKVSILVPFKDQAGTTRRCIDRILGVTAYRNFEVVLIDNWSTGLDTAKLVAEVAADPRVRVLRVEEDFNYSRLNNGAAAQLETDLLLFLNNDVFVEQPDWLRLMVNEMLADPHVGIVGAKLIYPDQTVQHAGVVLGVGGVADHPFRYYRRDEPGYCSRAVCAQDMSAVTAACMLCRADAFRAVGGFDETNLPVAFNDVDLCLRVGRAGYRIVMTPAVMAEHHESLSRGDDLAEHKLPRFYGENQYMWERWRALLKSDPFYNPHFSHESGMFETLSSASLTLAQAPSLLQAPQPRAVLPPGERYPEPSELKQQPLRRPLQPRAPRRPPQAATGTA